MGRKTKAHLVVNRIDINEVPEGDKEAAKWLSDLMVKKDETLDHFHQTGKFNVDVSGKCSGIEIFTHKLLFYRRNSPTTPLDALVVHFPQHCHGCDAPDCDDEDGDNQHPHRRPHHGAGQSGHQVLRQPHQSQQIIQLRK